MSVWLIALPDTTMCNAECREDFWIMIVVISELLQIHSVSRTAAVFLLSARSLPSHGPYLIPICCSQDSRLIIPVSP